MYSSSYVSSSNCLTRSPTLFRKMTTVKDSPYSGTIYTNDVYKGGCTKSLSKELFFIPSAYKSKISVVVKASSGAQILLYDENKDEKWALKITLSLDKGTTSNIGLNTRDPAQEAAYPTREFQTPSILSGSHFKAFVIQWNHGLVQVFDDGGDENKPLLSWKGPADYRVCHFGVRTLWSFGTWRVQGGPEFNTTETNDIGAAYQHYQVNSGRLEFEIRAEKDAYLILSGNANDDDVTKLMHVIIGGWTNARSAIWESLVERANYAQAATLSPYEYRRFWVEWDAYSMRAGVYGTTLPKMFYNSAKALTQLTYFGFVSAMGSKGYFRVLEVDDSDSASGAQPTIGSY